MASDSPHSLLPVEERFHYLSQAFDRVESGEVTEESLGRHLRLSTTAYKTLTETISQSLEAVTKDPSASVKYLAIIERCNRLLKLSDDSTSKDTFPFTELPREVRDMVYKFIFSVKDGHEIYPSKRRLCRDEECCCGRFPCGENVSNLKIVDSAIMATNQLIRSESAPLFYKGRSFCFPCPADLFNYISCNCYFRSNVIKIAVLWHGGWADKAFSLLGQCKSLESLEIIVNSETTSHQTEREMLRMAHHLPSRTRLFDTLGIDELLALRGLKAVQVTVQSSRRWGFVRKALRDETIGLQALLQSKVLLPRSA